jgi:hypothetical protein
LESPVSNEKVPTIDTVKTAVPPAFPRKGVKMDKGSPAGIQKYAFEQPHD